MNRFCLKVLPIALLAGALVAGAALAQNSAARKTSARSASGSNKTSSARSATGSSKTSSARSASGSNKKVSARSSTGTNRARAGSVGRTRAAMTRSNRIASGTSAMGRSEGMSLARNMSVAGIKVKTEKVDENACPVGQVLKKVMNTESLEEEIYVSPDKKCDAPLNSREVKWIESLGLPVPLSWVAKESAVVYQCEPGFMQRTAPDGKTYCLDTDQVCPINAPLKRVVKNNVAVLVDPDSEDSCIVPALTSFRMLNNADGILELQCPYNTYSKPLDGAGTDHIICESCPKGYVTMNPGGMVPGVCVRKCPLGEAAEADATDDCKPCSFNAKYDETSAMCRCNPGYYGSGIGDENKDGKGCAACEPGSYCATGVTKQAVDETAGEYAPFRGMAAPKQCPVGTTSAIVSCNCEGNNKEFNIGQGKCVFSRCEKGFTLDNGECKPCRAGHYCPAGGY